jgi:hypothetical protein
MKKDWWAPGGGKEGQNPRTKGKGKPSVNVADTSKKADDIWLADGYTSD